MIRYSMTCDDGHSFDGWFGSAAGYERLDTAGLLACAQTGWPQFLRSASLRTSRSTCRLFQWANCAGAWSSFAIGENILAFDANAAQVWGRLRVPRAGHELDKQIAAIALVNDLTIVTRNTADFDGTGARLINPFA